MSCHRTLEINQYEVKYQQKDIEGECILLAVQSIIFVRWKFLLFCLLSVVTVGILLLLTYWFPNLRRWFYYDFSPLNQATHFLVENYDNTLQILPKQIQHFFDGKIQFEAEYFVNRYLKYIVTNSTINACSYDQLGRLPSLIKSSATGWTERQAQKLLKYYGPGAMVIDQPGPSTIFAQQIFRPLYIFLMLNVIVETEIQYYYFSTIILVSAIIGVILTIVEVMKVNQKIFEMSYYEVQLHVMREGEIQQISSRLIVPGDLVFLNKEIRMPFEAILLQGELLINQCVLTGQSVPVIKKPESKSGDKFERSCILFQGTTIVQINARKRMNVWEKYRMSYGVPVCVTKTNFFTLKGQLIRKILFPSQTENIFQKQSTKFLYFLFCVVLGCYFMMVFKLASSIDTWTIVRRGFDLISIGVPPTLPISMTIGIIYAIQKLKKKDIYTISPNQIIEGGLLDTMCFDKTGTLTHDSMDFKMLLPSHQAQFREIIINKDSKHAEYAEKYVIMAIANMGTNHTVVKLEKNNELIGDPMEIRLLQFSRYALDTDSDDDPGVIFKFSGQLSGSVYRRFEFDSDVQRMSVVCQLSDGRIVMFAKGSPQIMLSIMHPSSVPKDYRQKLKEYASSGFRILAIAHKTLQGEELIRWKNALRFELQSNLSFDGFQIFQNGLKEETRAAIQQFRSININPIMITGDNPITASNIAYQSAILDPHSKTLIVDFVQNQFTYEEFHYSIQGLAEVSFSRPPFLRKSQTGETGSDPVLKVVDQLLEKMQQNNYNVCLTGSSFNYFFKEIDVTTKEPLHPILRDLLMGTKVLARTKPYDKAKVVRLHQREGKVVGMCGDGANDCAALNQANLGLSLSDTEASIAAAFTAKQRHIGSMIQLVKESRAGLATNFSLFNIMASYGLTQYSSSLINQFFFSYPAEGQFIYWDIILNLFFVFLLGNIGTAPRLTPERPSASLLSFSNLIKLFSYFVFAVIAQVVALLAVNGPFAEEVDYYRLGGQENNLQRYLGKGGGDFLMETVQNNVIFLVINFFYLASVVVFTISKPWKLQFYTYWPFFITFVLVIAYTLLIAVIPETRLGYFKLSYVEYSPDLNIFLLMLSLGTSMIIVILHKCILDPFFHWQQSSQSNVE